MAAPDNVLLNKTKPEQGSIDLAAMPKIAAAPRRQSTRDESATDRSIRDIERAPDGLTRQRVGTVDQFALPEQVRARYAEAGWSLEWKRNTCFGQEDWSYENSLAENHWQAVGSDELPGLMPPGYSGAVIRDGLMLMKRPAYLTEEARSEERRAALGQIAAKEAQLADAPQGTLPRDHAEIAPKIGKGYAPLEIPADE